MQPNIKKPETGSKQGKLYLPFIPEDGGYMFLRNVG
jgi:hypothetical protein